MQGFYYLHENGDLIYKPHATYEDMDSSFVKRYWTANDFGGTPQRLVDSLTIALYLGAKESEVRRIMACNHIKAWLPNAYEQVGIEEN